MLVYKGAMDFLKSVIYWLHFSVFFFQHDRYLNPIAFLWKHGEKDIPASRIMCPSLSVIVWFYFFSSLTNYISSFRQNIESTLLRALKVCVCMSSVSERVIFKSCRQELCGLRGSISLAVGKWVFLSGGSLMRAPGNRTTELSLTWLQADRPSYPIMPPHTSTSCGSGCI